MCLYRECIDLIAMIVIDCLQMCTILKKATLDHQHFKGLWVWGQSGSTTLKADSYSQFTPSPPAYNTHIHVHVHNWYYPYTPLLVQNNMYIIVTWWHVHCTTKLLGAFEQIDTYRQRRYIPSVRLNFTPLDMKGHDLPSLLFPRKGPSPAPHIAAPDGVVQYTCTCHCTMHSALLIEGIQCPGKGAMPLTRETKTQ